jgi:hypothetical protein
MNVVMKMGFLGCGSVAVQVPAGVPPTTWRRDWGDPVNKGEGVPSKDQPHFSVALILCYRQLGSQLHQR